MKISCSSISSCPVLLLFLFLFSLHLGSAGNYFALPPGVFLWRSLFTLAGEAEEGKCNSNWVFDDWQTISSSRCFHQPVSQAVPSYSINLNLISIWEYLGTTALAVYNKCFDIIYFLISFVVAVFQPVFVFTQSIISKPAFIKGLSYFKHLQTLMWPVINGLTVIIFSWIIMHFDSQIPGVYPPSPISPKKDR